MNKKRISQAAIVFTILVFPSLLYVILAAGNHDIARLPFIGPRSPHPTQTNAKGIPDTIYYQIPDFSIYDYQGQLVDKERLEGRHLIIDFVCTSCNEISPRITSQMVAVQERFINKKNIAMLSVMIDSENDTKEAIVKYKNGLKVQEDENWYFLTGTPDQVRTFGEGLLLDDINKSDQKFETNIISVVDKEGHIRGHFDGKQYVETKEVIDMIKALLFTDFKATKENSKDEELVRRK